MALSPGRAFRSWLFVAALVTLLLITLTGCFLEEEGWALAGRLSIALVIGLAWVQHRRA